MVIAPTSTGAATLNIDEIIYQPGAGLDPAMLSGSVDAGISGTTLTITLTNTSLSTGGDTSGWLLTGLGFYLPEGVTLTNLSAVVSPGSSGAYSISGTTYALVQGDNLRGEWGGGDPSGSGPFSNLTTKDVNYVTATLQSAFFDGSPFDPTAVLKNPDDVDGPEFGLLSRNFADAGGLGYIKDSITFQWTIVGEGLTTDYLNDRDVVISFGSPTAVPEAGALLLFGTGLFGLVGYRRMRRMQ
jgi:hypothetical protein